jgi:hypothetical protein
VGPGDATSDGFVIFARVVIAYFLIMLLLKPGKIAFNALARCNETSIDMTVAERVLQSALALPDCRSVARRWATRVKVEVKAAIGIDVAIDQGGNASAV